MMIVVIIEYSNSTSQKGISLVKINIAVSTYQFSLLILIHNMVTFV